MSFLNILRHHLLAWRRNKEKLDEMLTNLENYVRCIVRDLHVACSRPSVGGAAVRRAPGTPLAPALSPWLAAAFFARRCFRSLQERFLSCSLPPIESLGQAIRDQAGRICHMSLSKQVTGVSGKTYDWLWSCPRLTEGERTISCTHLFWPAVQFVRKALFSVKVLYQQRKFG